MRNISIQDGVEGVGASQGYVGICVHYDQIDCSVNGPTPVVRTAWQFTPEEIERLQAGAVLVLSILGRQQPPIHLGLIEPVEFESD